MNKKVITDLEVRSKRVIVRVDFNVPMSKTEEGKITDNARIVAALPTIKYLIENNAKVILLSHLLLKFYFLKFFLLAQISFRL